MCDVPLDLQALSLNVKADYLESNLEFLKELDRQLPDTTLSEPTQPSSSAPIQLPAAVLAPLATESVSDHVNVLNQVFESTVPRMPESMTVKGKRRRWEPSHQTTRILGVLLETLFPLQNERC